ncbi:MAG: phosphohydrolase [Vicinamibacterales bacterium]
MSPLPPSSPLYGRRDWISTYSGQPFFPLEPRVEDVRIGDIAHALAQLCRFAGQCRAFYSVAQHSVLVSRFCPPEHALWGLLHDASEAYLCDITSPVKGAPALEGYRAIERGVQAAIATRFGLPIEEPAAVKDADQVLLRTEQRDLLLMPAGWYADRVAFLYRLVPLSCERAEQQFLERFEELTGGAR